MAALDAVMIPVSIGTFSWSSIKNLALIHAATGWRGAGFTVSADLLCGDPDEVISREVQRREIKLLVMGAYGHSRVRQHILGSTTTHLIRTGHVPMRLFR